MEFIMFCILLTVESKTNNFVYVLKATESKWNLIVLRNWFYKRKIIILNCSEIVWFSFENANSFDCAWKIDFLIFLRGCPYFIVE